MVPSSMYCTQTPSVGRKEGEGRDRKGGKGTGKDTGS